MSLVVKRPWVSLVVVTTALAVMTSGFAEVRENPVTEAPGWLVVVVLGLIVVGAINTFLFPRLAKHGRNGTSEHHEEWRVLYVQWMSAIGIYLVAVSAWFLFGVPVWLPVLAGITSATVLIVLIATSTNRHQKREEQSR